MGPGILGTEPMMPPKVDILLSAYNGAKFITEQIESILAQTCDQWRLIVRDDGSTDLTRSIVAAFARAHPDRITVLEDSQGNLGVVRSFGQLLGQSAAPYVMFCDQDDVWLPEKVALQLREITALETTRSVHQPLAVFTDALVVDAELRPLAGSLLKYINRDPARAQHLNRLCMEGACYGCTMILNRALVDRVGVFPPGVISHDWWCGLVAAAFGQLAFVDCAPIKHRRHAANVSATKRNSLTRYLRQRASLEQHRKWLHQVLAQCEVFHRTYAGQLPEEPQRLFSVLARVRSGNWLVRRVLLIRQRVWPTGLVRNIGYFLAV